MMIPPILTANTMKKTLLTRKFKFGEIMLEDPNPAFTPERVISFYAAHYPAMTTSKISGPTQTGDNLVFDISTNIGTKG